MRGGRARWKQKSHGRSAESPPPTISSSSAKTQQPGDNEVRQKRTSTRELSNDTIQWRFPKRSETIGNKDKRICSQGSHTLGLEAARGGERRDLGEAAAHVLDLQLHALPLRTSGNEET